MRLWVDAFEYLLFRNTALQIQRRSDAIQFQQNALILKSAFYPTKKVIWSVINKSTTNLTALSLSVFCSATPINWVKIKDHLGGMKKIAIG